MAKIRDGSTYLDSHLCANDYYAEGESVVGRWHGRLAARLGLTPEKKICAGDPAFRLLRENINPATGGKLTQRNVEGSIRFFDFQCSAQKSVSVMYAIAGDDRLAAAHDRAAAKAFKELERFAACRMRKGDAAWSQDTRLTGNVCAAAFRHDASRALDPQLHTHFVVANATWDEQQQRMVALESCEMIKAIRYAGKVYQNELAREVKSLGYAIDPSRNDKGVVEGFEIQGVSPAICQRFSKRRAEIEKGIEEFKETEGRRPSASEIAVITRQTRNGKLAETSTPAVRAAQVAQLSPAERQQLVVLNAIAVIEAGSVDARGSLRQMPEPANARDVLEAAVAHRFERASVLRGHEVLSDALNACLGTVDLETLKREIRAGSADLVALEATDDGDPLSVRFATCQGLALEEWSVGFVNQTKDRCTPLLSSTFEVAAWLSDEQKEAVRFVGASRDQVMAIRGVAGAGKTTLLKELDGHLTAAQHKMLYLAPTASAVKVLQSEGFANALTVAEYLVRTQTPTMPREWQDAVIVVDEAGLSSNQQGATLLTLAERAHQRMVFVGDSRQHSSVDAGDFLRVLEAHSELTTCELKDIRRQTVAEYNQAVRLLASGQAAAGMQSFDRLGWIKAGDSNYLGAAALEYLRLVATAAKREEVLCVAPTWAENHVLTQHIRHGLHASGSLGVTHRTTVLDPLGWTMQQRRTAANYRAGQVVTFNREVPGSFQKGQTVCVERVEGKMVFLTGNVRLDPTKAAFFDVATTREIDLSIGDRILLRMNDKKSNLVNGDVLTVKSVDTDGTIETLEGKTVPASYRHFTHGYVVTSHKSQGRTADHVVVAAARLDSKAAYVACSRGRQSCTVFTPDKERLFADLPRSADRLAALDVLRARENSSRSRTTLRPRGFRIDGVVQAVSERLAKIISKRRRTDVVAHVHHRGPSMSQ